MKLIQFIILYAILLAITATCPNGTVSNISGDKCYFISNISKEFDLAESDCKNFQNGHLASVSNAFENMNLTAYTSNNLGSNATFVWLGGNKDNNSVWQWTDGQNMSYTNWVKGNPMHDPRLNCMALEVPGGLWFSQDCDNNLPYVCEVDSCTTEDCVGCHDGYHLFTPTNMCYKIVPRMNETYFDDSENFCVNEGGHLVSLHSRDEEIFVNNLTLQLPNESHFWIGFEDPTNNDEWKWTDGTVVNFTNWGCAAPDYHAPCSRPCAYFASTNIDHHCGTIFWDNCENCASSSLPFICKREPKTNNKGHS